MAAVSVPELRPLSVGEIIDVALKIWRRHFGTLARIVLVVVAPIEIVSALVLASVTPESTQRLGSAEAAAAGLGTFVSVVLNLLAFLLSSAAILQAVSVAYLGGQPDWRESLRTVAARLGSLVWLFVLMGAGLTLAFLLFFGPGVWLAVSWSLAYAVLVAEGLAGPAALSRSYHLVKGRWWPTLGALALAFLIQVVVGAVVGIPLGIISFNSEPGSVAALISSVVGNTVSSVLTTSLFGAVLVLIYYDLRVRKEGFDLTVMARHIGVADAGPAVWAPPGPPSGPPAGPPSPPSPPPAGPPSGPPSSPPPDSSWPPPGSPSP